MALPYAGRSHYAHAPPIVGRVEGGGGVGVQAWDWNPYTLREPPCMRCGAKTRTGEPCKTAARPNGRCRMHGGSTPKGLALPQTTHGLYSSSLPVRLAGRYQEALADAELLELKREAALLTAFTDEQLAKLDTGETGAHWARLQEAWTEYEKTGEKDKQQKLWRVGRLIEDGAREAEAVREIRSSILDKARVAESERKRLADSDQLITMQQMLALVGALSAAILAEVRDREQRARIMDRFDRALSGGAPGAGSP
jgi:hypothetical protein